MQASTPVAATAPIFLEMPMSSPILAMAGEYALLPAMIEVRTGGFISGALSNTGWIQRLLLQGPKGRPQKDGVNGSFYDPFTPSFWVRIAWATTRIWGGQSQVCGANDANRSPGLWHETRWFPRREGERATRARRSRRLRGSGRACQARSARRSCSRRRRSPRRSRAGRGFCKRCSF